jgi:uncharacterized protein (TIGR02757 family)
VSPLLGERLDALTASFDASRLHPDPLEIVRTYRSPADQEVAGLVCAGLAFGGVETILVNARKALRPLGKHPAQAITGSNDREIRKALKGFRHRWVDGDDVAALLSSIRTLRKEHGSLESAFLAGDPGGKTVEGALSAFAAAVKGADPGFANRGAAAFVPSPAGGSACKRPLLYLRWMVRRDGLDVGAWKRVDPSRLVLPLDTHVARISRALGLLRRKTDDWKAALQATAALRRFDAADPVRYDFAICHMGILDLCPRERDPVHCRACELFDVCRYGSRGVTSP